jgi:ATP-dependent Clp protease ATP-binding subunit ClpC
MLTFSPDAHQLLQLSRKEADRLCHQYVGTEHLLLGMLKAEDGIVHEFLRSLTPDLGAFCSDIENGASAERDESRASSPYSARFRRVMALAEMEASKLGSSFLRSEHMLLGLLREGGGHSVALLQWFGAHTDQLRQLIADLK